MFGVLDRDVLALELALELALLLAVMVYDGAMGGEREIGGGGDDEVDICALGLGETTFFPSEGEGNGVGAAAGAAAGEILVPVLVPVVETETEAEAVGRTRSGDTDFLSGVVISADPCTWA